MEFAPASRHSACRSSDIASRPAESRTWARGMSTRATAIARTKSNGSTSGTPASGVPGTFPRRLRGTLLVGARGDDLPVELRRGVEIVVVVVEPRRLQLRGLCRGEHAERRAAL